MYCSAPVNQSVGPACNEGLKVTVDGVAAEGLELFQGINIVSTVT